MYSIQNMALCKEGDKTGDAKQVVLCGDLSRELPRQRSKVVRIFTSSTFTDTSTERNALMRDTYPRLKDYCKSRHGLEFQVIDMRWGVRDEATDDHMTSQLCMAEIAACQRLSVGPNFVTFLCQKYGYRPFPPKIACDEFNILRQTLVDNGKPIGTLDTWFIRDDNCVPPVYVLQPISSKLPYFSRNDEPEKMKAQQGEWWTTFELLQGQLRFAANEAEKRGVLSADLAKKYRVSVTHDEVDHGILNAPQDRQDHCLCFIRKFSDLQSKSETREAAKFIDVQAGKVDIEAQELLSELRDKKVAEVLPQSNIILTQLGEWTKDGVSLEKARHEEYVRGFLDTFYTKMVSMIDVGVFKEKQASLEDPLHQEILQHLSFCVTKCVGFQGRDDIISKVRDYVLQRAKGDGGGKGVPMVLHGESGCGKTSIMAKCASLVKQSWLAGTDTVMVLRFLGTSSNTSSIQRVLAMLCKHILQVYNEREFQVPTEYNKLVAALPKILKFATVKKPLVIFLDSLDQLSSEHGAHRMGWLPKALPAYVAIVVSTLPREHDILEKIKERLPSASPYIQVDPFSQEESTDILKSWLATDQKGVTTSQLELIDKAVAACSLPLFLKLVFDQVAQWRSYHPPEKCILQPSIQDMINLIFQRLEEYHGQLLVSRALSYITLSPSGLTETELDDLLSLDDDVLNDVYQFWMPPVRRIPPSLWTRVRNDISSYLVDRDADGVTVMYWYHRQFIAAASQRYLSDMSLNKKLHKTCAEYFDGAWSEGRKKPCRYSSLQVQRFGVPAEAEEDRKVSSQPLTFSSEAVAGEGDSVAFNLRKLTQLPFHLTQAEDWEALKTCALFNFDFLLSKVKALSMQDVLGDFYRVEEKIEDAEVSILLGALRLSSSVLSNDPDQLAPELLGRLLNATTKFPMLKSLLDQAYERGCHVHPMLPVSACLQPPGGMLLTSLEGHTEEVIALAITSDSRLAVTGSKDNTARIWQVDNGTLIHTLTGHREAVHGIEIAPDDQSCVTYSHTGEYMKSGKICVWNMETGDLIHRLKGHTGKGESNLAVSVDGRYAVTGLQTKIDYDSDNEDTDYEEDEIITVAKRKHKEEKKKELMSEENEEWDEEEYEDESRHAVIIWNLETGQVMHWLLKHTQEIKGVLTTEIDDRQIAMTFSQDRTLVLWDMLKGGPIREMTDADDFPIWIVALSADRRRLAVHGCEISLHSFPDCQFLGDTRDPDSSSTVNSMYITRDNSRVISGHCCGLVRMYGTGEGTERTLLKRQNYFDGDAITSMAITPDEKYVVVASKKEEAVVLNLETLEVEAKLSHILSISKVAVTPDGSKVLTASADKNVRVWDLESLGKTAAADEPDLTISKHDDYIYVALTLNAEDKVITAGHDGTIKLWDVQSGMLIKSLRDPMENTCHAVAISSNDTFMVSCSNGWCVLSLPDLEVQRRFRERYITPSNCFITPDDRRLVGGIGQPKFEIRIFHLETGQTLQIINLRSYSLHMLRHGVFVNQYKISICDSTGKTKILQLIDSGSGRVVGELRHGEQVLSYAVSPDERRLVAGCNDSDVDLWNLKSFSHVTTMKGHAKPVQSVAFSPDGTLIASGANGGEVIIWDAESKSMMYSLKEAHESDIAQVVFSPDNRFLVSCADDDLYVQVWNAKSGKHMMKYNTYAKTRLVIMSKKCNSAVITLEDGRVLFLKFSSSFSPASPGTAAGQSGQLLTMTHTSADGSKSTTSALQERNRQPPSPNKTQKSKTCQML